MCRSIIAAFLRKVQKYKKSLRKGGSNSTILDLWRKICWHYFVASDLAKFRSRIENQARTISVLMLSSTLYVRLVFICLLSRPRLSGSLSPYRSSVTRIEGALHNSQLPRELHWIPPDHLRLTDALGRKMIAPFACCATLKVRNRELFDDHFASSNKTELLTRPF
jgi:hypothetical protein